MPQKTVICVDTATTDVESLSALFALLAQPNCPYTLSDMYVFTEGQQTGLSVAVPLDAAINKMFRKTHFFALPLGLCGDGVDPKELTLYLAGFVSGRATNSPFDTFAEAIKPHIGTLSSFLGGSNRSARSSKLFVLSKRAWTPDYPLINTSTDGVQVLTSLDEVKTAFTPPQADGGIPPNFTEFFERVFAGAAAATVPANGNAAPANGNASPPPMAEALSQVFGNMVGSAAGGQQGGLAGFDQLIQNLQQRRTQGQ
jgi:hypothetical protein